MKNEMSNEEKIQQTFETNANESKPLLDKLQLQHQLQIEIGKTRVQDKDKYPGTVAYIGTVASAKNSNEIYVGVEWDDPTRGKHDGSVLCRKTNKKVRHFQPKNTESPTPASFIRASKLDCGNNLDIGIMTNRYVTEDAELVAPNNTFQNCYARTSKGLTKPIELLGEIKIRKKQQIHDLTSISLRNCGIAKLVDNPSTELLDLGSRYIEVDLGGNLICDWHQVMKMLLLFNRAENFSFAHNRLQDINDGDILFSNQIPNLIILNLNQCYIQSFETLLIIAKSMPQLEELYLSGNNIADIQNMNKLQIQEKENLCNMSSKFTQLDIQRNILLEKSIFKNLSLLDCSNCGLTSWENQVDCFAQLPNLKTLILDNNSISSITLTTYPKIKCDDALCDSKTGESNIRCYFPQLTSLQIASNRISSWDSIDALSIKTFPHLTSLRFRNNPVTSNMGAGEARAIIIARIGGSKLLYLNASIISDRERVESERRYVRNVASQLSVQTSKYKTNENNNTNVSNLDAMKMKFLSHHPRFDELVKIHATSMVGVNPFDPNFDSASLKKGGNFGSLGNETVLVTIRSMASNSCTMQPVTKRLPLSLKIERLKHLCERIFKLSTEYQILHLKNDAKDPFPLSLDDDEQNLSYWGVAENAEILMNEFDPELEKLEKIKDASEYEKRMIDQELIGNIKKEGIDKAMIDYTIAAKQAAAN